MQDRKVKAKQIVFLNFDISGNNFPFSDNLNLSINPQEVRVKEVNFAPNTVSILPNNDAIIYVRTPMIKERNQLIATFRALGTEKRPDTIFDCYDVFSVQSFDLLLLTGSTYSRWDNTFNLITGDLSMTLEFTEYYTQGLQNAVVMPPTKIPEIWQTNMPVQNPNNQIGLY